MEDGAGSGRSAAAAGRQIMNEAIRKATAELEALACELEHQVTAWNKDLPGVAARLRALAAHVATIDQPEGAPRFLPGAATARGEQNWHVVLSEPDLRPVV
jgi:hypothetical protein